MSRAKEIKNLLEFIPGSGKSKQTITIEYINDGSREALNKLLGTIDRLCNWGSSRTVVHSVDGDGAYRVKIKGLDKVDLPDTEPDKIWVPGYD
jgi:hypothetical protein